MESESELVGVSAESVKSVEVSLGRVDSMEVPVSYVLDGRPKADCWTALLIKLLKGGTFVFCKGR